MGANQKMGVPLNLPSLDHTTASGTERDLIISSVDGQLYRHNGTAYVLVGGGGGGGVDLAHVRKVAAMRAY